MTKPFRWALVGDLQIPYHDQRAVDLWFKVMKSYRPDAIDVVGDIDDFLEFSRFSDGTTDDFFAKLKKARVAGENEDFSPVPYVLQVSEKAKSFYTAIREANPHADIFAALGNHEERVFSYMDKKAPDFVNEITPDSLWDLKNLGIPYALYQTPPTERFAGIHVHHGATVSSGGMAVAKDIDNYNVSLARGHDHLGGVVFKTYPMRNETLIGLACGHMCDPRGYGLKYTINPSWQLGFATVEIDTLGNPNAQFHRISPDYTVVFNGKLYKG